MPICIMQAHGGHYERLFPFQDVSVIVHVLFISPVALIKGRLLNINDFLKTCFPNIPLISAWTAAHCLGGSKIHTNSPSSTSVCSSR